VKGPQRSKPQQEKLEERKRKSKAKKKLVNIKKQKARSLIYQLHWVIHKYFPDLFDRMRQIQDCREKSDYGLAELITACIAMYIFKEGSRNAFNNDRQEEKFKENYRKIFKMRLPHMDTVDKVMRRLAESELEKLKTRMIQTLLEKKTLHKFRFLKKWFVVAVDGSGIMSFSEKHCDQCSHKTSKNGKTTWFHNVLEAKLVCSNGFALSLATEWIDNADTPFKKQDCERKAFERLAKKLKKIHPRLPICITADGLYPNQTFFSICQSNQWCHILTFKPGNLPSIWKKVELLLPSMNDNGVDEIIAEGSKKIYRLYRWINGIDYHGYKLNWVECREFIEDSKENKKENGYFVHITDQKISRLQVSEISATGRLRWKIENEGFNTQKNLGYKLKHKYSRVSWLAAKNYYQCLQIGHLINQLVELSERCRQLLTGKITIKHLWKALIGFLTYCIIGSAELSMLSQLRTQIRLE
jgi:hypothetical protein